MLGSCLEIPAGILDGEEEGQHGDQAHEVPSGEQDPDLPAEECVPEGGQEPEVPEEGLREEEQDLEAPERGQDAEVPEGGVDEGDQDEEVHADQDVHMVSEPDLPGFEGLLEGGHCTFACNVLHIMPRVW